MAELDFDPVAGSDRVTVDGREYRTRELTESERAAFARWARERGQDAASAAAAPAGVAYALNVVLPDDCPEVTEEDVRRAAGRAAWRDLNKNRAKFSDEQWRELAERVTAWAGPDPSGAEIPKWGDVWRTASGARRAGSGCGPTTTRLAWMGGVAGTPRTRPSSPGCGSRGRRVRM